MILKPWREIILPHRDVLEETFRQAEFNINLNSIHQGKAPRELQEAAAFFDRTFITEGLKSLLAQVAQRLAGKDGAPVIPIQAHFGNGKTHALLAAYHLARYQGPLNELIGIPVLLDSLDLDTLPQAHVVILDGAAHSPSQHWKHGQRIIRTLWGELAWQLGGEEAFNWVWDADAAGTAPTKEIIRDLLESYAPCLILIDNLIEYLQQFPEGRSLIGGSYESNLSFLQTLITVAHTVSTAVLLVTLPQAEGEISNQRGMTILRTLEKTLDTKHASWQPVTNDEVFEVVRCRLFDPVRDPAAYDTVCHAFAKIYQEEGAKLPPDTQENNYLELLIRAYPIHPEIFTRFYQDWIPLKDFPYLRGILKFMAKVVLRLWQDNQRELIIMPGSLPLYDFFLRSDLISYLSPGWETVITRDIDGDQAGTIDLESRDARFSLINAAHRVARTIFFGTAPFSVQSATSGFQGLERSRILLGCLQPGQAPSIYFDVLGRLAERLHYLNRTNHNQRDVLHFWFGINANPRREIEERKHRIDENALREKIIAVMEKILGTLNLFTAVHLLTTVEEVPDDSALRLIVLAPHQYYSTEDAEPAFAILREYLRGTRRRANRLLFLAAERGEEEKINNAARAVLALDAFLDEAEKGRLNLELAQKHQLEKEARNANELLTRVVRECYRWLLCPAQKSPHHPALLISVLPLNTTIGAFGSEIERVCIENELILVTWSPIHLREKLKEFYWSQKHSAINAMDFWEDSLRFLYLPRLKNREVLARTIQSGATSRDFFGTSYGRKGDEFEGFHLGDGIIEFDNTLLLIDPEVARAYEKNEKNQRALAENIAPPTNMTNSAFQESIEISPAMLTQFIEQINTALARHPRATIKITIEI